jgi:lysophospholipase L1-like esterase
MLGLLTATFSLAVLFGGLEVALRLKGGAPSLQPLFMDDSTVGYRPRPGAFLHYATSEFTSDIQINSLGVRDEEFGPKALTERRIVVIGDSMVMAIQVPLAQTFVKQLQQALNRPAGLVRYRVVDAGVQGYGTVEEYLFLKETIDRLQPDVVLVAVFVGNDAVEAGDAAWRLSPKRAVPRLQRVAAAGGLWGRRLARRSAAFQFLRQNLLTVASPTGEAPLRQRPLDSYLDPAPPDVLQGFTVAAECIERIVSLARSRGAATAVALLPARFQLSDEDFSEMKIAVARSGRALARDAATDRFRTATAKIGLPVLDLLPVFRAQPDPAGLFFKENVHLTARGHQAVANALATFLGESHLLDPGGSPPAPLPRP